jgi:DNA-binding transcriptional LysR family regulator
VAVGPIVAAVRAQAPKLRLQFVPSGTLNLADRLDRGELDLVISGLELAGERFASHPLIDDHYVATFRRGHPALRRKLSIDVLAQTPHLGVSSSGENLEFLAEALKLHNGQDRFLRQVIALSTSTVVVCCCCRASVKSRRA